MDPKLQTFMLLCRTMNYRQTAEQLHLTQPAVTRQIQSLEQQYNVKLFTYDGRRLTKTPACALLEEYAMTLQYNDAELEAALKGCVHTHLRIGATKTIGDYVIPDMVRRYLSHPGQELSLVVDNTVHLLNMLGDNELDFAIVEGFFDKRRYDYSLLRMEPFMGICPADHPFAHRQVGLDELFEQSLILREPGSGTRDIFETELAGLGHTISSFRRVISISSFKLIKDMLLAGFGVTFAYAAIIEDDRRFAPFTLGATPSMHEFNFVYLKGTKAGQYADRFAAYA